MASIGDYGLNPARVRHRVADVPRSRGAVNGLLVFLLGIWGAVIPFIGPYLNLAYEPDTPWTMTADRLWLNVLPGVAALLGGLGLVASASRGGGVVWGWLAAVGGGWFVLGPTVSALWNGGTGDVVGDNAGVRVAAQLVFHYGLGVLILFLAAVALGRFTVADREAVIDESEYDDRTEILRDEAQVDDETRRRTDRT
ncbi:hypothetical protein [Actinokineospora sp. HUAS TT18]|uniref:hypothetical protein n=1 Tax=Actinokineospora sp. HUAS TT18 TaxID=3447451 RepID=UPI003F51B9BD